MAADITYRLMMQSARLQPLSWHRALLILSTLLLLLLLAGCATPVQVNRVGPREVQRELTSNVISTGQISPDSQIVLQQRGLWEYYQINPQAAIAFLHRSVTTGPPDPDVLFALAEMSFHFAESTGDQPNYLAATVYAYAFLFPDDPAQRPNEFDPRVRTAGDIYNRGLTSAFASADRSEVTFQSGKFALPFGSIDIAFDPTSARWGDLILTHFIPADELRVTGLRSDYRKHGLGASLAADATSQVKETGFQLAPLAKVPVTALLRIDLSPAALAGGHLRGSIDVYPAFEPSVVTLGGEQVPLRADPSAAFAYGLSSPQIWASEYAGFMNGSLLNKIPSQLVGLEPYHPGQFPVVFIHGTASSSGRWADMINDLLSEPVIRDHFQFWLFEYNTGNPIPFSALQLRQALKAAVQKLDPQDKDSALHDMVLIGHSQGGLLAKMMVVDTGSRLWDAFSNKTLDELRISDKTRDLLRQAIFLKPVPEVRTVIFISTPQHGSYVAGSWIGEFAARFVSFPGRVTSALADTLQDNADALNMRRATGGFTSVWGMTPGNPAMKALAATPIAPDVSAYSIIAVQGNGPVETGNDGVVTYKSAHIDDVKSEFIVRSGHSSQANPLTIAEVRRILLLHLAAACPNSCPPMTARDGRPLASTPNGNVLGQQLSALAVSDAGELSR